ncbi:hypothetical protein D6C86_04803 [Aureobasidium pullulans]|nr:hypothetical protein D6C86_04803 [Aureobasidium pullulans]
MLHKGLSDRESCHWLSIGVTPSHGSPYEAGSPRNPFPGVGSQYLPRGEGVSVHSSPDAMLNGTLVASAARLHRVREELLSTPSGMRQPDVGRSSSRRRRQDRSLSRFRDLDTPTRRSRPEPASARSTRSARSVRFQDEAPLAEGRAPVRV